MTPFSKNPSYLKVPDLSHSSKSSPDKNMRESAAKEGIGNLSSGQSVKINSPEEQNEKINLAEQIAYEHLNDGEKTIDDNRLLKSKRESPNIRQENLNFHISGAIFRSLMDPSKKGKLSPENTTALSILILNQYSKAAPSIENQTSPFGEFGYHRQARNENLARLESDFSLELNINTKFEKILLLEDDSTHQFREVLLTDLGEQVRAVRDRDDFNSLISNSEELKDIKSKTPWIWQRPQSPILDLTALKLTSEELRALSEEMKDSLKGDITPFLISFIDYKNESILWIRHNSPYAFTSLGAHFNHLRSSTGFILTPEHLCKAQISIKTLGDLFKNAGITEAEFAIPSKEQPIIYESYSAFIQGENSFFQILTDPEKSPLDKNQQILTQGLVNMLRGLGHEENNQKIMDAFSSEKGLADYLQYSYFRIRNAFGEAIFKRDNLLEFQKSLDVVSQEIHTILSIVEPYENTELENCIRHQLHREDGLIKNAALSVSVSAQPSAMRCLATIVSSAQAQKRDKSLSVLILKDSYYESADVLGKAKKIKSSSLDGDKFNCDPSIIDELEGNIDLFLCEFHHNISVDRLNYQAENLTGQIKALFAKNKVATQLHVVIDTTINLDMSNDLSSFFEDVDINKYIAEGRLNVTFFRSSQKFDMLGFDNYYGGIATTVNDGKSFGRFINQMKQPGNQLKGSYYQGLCHLHKCAWDQIEEYRQAIIENTAKLYEMLPPEALASDERFDVLRVCDMTDGKNVFLDFKFNPKFNELSPLFVSYFKNYCKDNNLPLTMRASFGFPNSNLVRITSEKNEKVRLNVGIEDEKILSLYAAFFKEFQGVLETAFREKGRLIEEISENNTESLKKFDLIKEDLQLILHNQGFQEKYLEYNVFKETVETLSLSTMKQSLASYQFRNFEILCNPALEFFIFLRLEYNINQISNFSSKNEALDKELCSFIKSSLQQHLFDNSLLSEEQKKAALSMHENNLSTHSYLSGQIKQNVEYPFPLEIQLIQHEQMKSYLTIDTNHQRLKTVLKDAFFEIVQDNFGEAFIAEENLSEGRSLCAFNLFGEKSFIDLGSAKATPFLNLLAQSLKDISDLCTKSIVDNVIKEDLEHIEDEGREPEDFADTLPFAQRVVDKINQHITDFKNSQKEEPKEL